MQKKAWVWQLAFQVLSGQLIKYVSDFEVLSIEGFLKGTMKGKIFFFYIKNDYCSLPSRGWFSVPFIPFMLRKNRDGHLMGRNQELGLVIKIFRNDEALFQEHQVYKVLSDKACSYVPKFFGCFENTLEHFSLVMSYNSQQVDKALTPFCLNKSPLTEGTFK